MAAAYCRLGLGEHNIFDKARENKDLYGDKDKEHNKGFMYSYIYKASPLRAFYSYLNSQDIGVPTELKDRITERIAARIGEEEEEEEY